MLGINFTLVLVAVSFVLFVYLLKVLFFDPIGNIKEQRASELSSLAEGAEAKQAQSEKLIAEINQKITAIKDKQAEELEEISQQAHKELSAQYKTAQEELTANSQEQIQSIKNTLGESIDNIETIAQPIAQVIYQKITC